MEITNEIFRNNDNKDMVRSIKTKLGKLSLEIVNNIKNIDELNKINFEEKIIEFLNNEKNKEIKDYCLKKEKDLIKLLKEELISYIPRRYCIEKTGLNKKMLFNSLEHMYSYCGPIQNFIINNTISIGWYLGTDKYGKEKRTISFAKNKTPYIIADEVIRHEEFEEVLKTEIDKSFYKKNKENISNLTTENKSKIDDLSPLLIDFIAQDKKRLCVFDDGTGLGKSYSSRRLIATIMENEYLSEKVNQFAYLTDRRINVANEINALREEYPHLSGEVLPILRNVDCILEHEEAFRNLPKIFKDNDEYKKLLSTLDSYNAVNKKNKNVKDIVEKNLIEYESQYRRKLKDILKKLFKERKILNNYEDKLKFLRSDSELKKIIEVYTNMLLRERKILFMTVDKAALPIDILIENRNFVFNQDKKFLKNSIIFFDESDAAAERILEIIVKQSTEAKIELIEKTNFFYSKFKYQKLSKYYYEKDDKLKSKIEEIVSKYEILKEKAYLEYSIKLKTEESGHWLFKKSSKTKPYKKSESETEYIILDEDSQDAYIVYESQISTDEKLMIYEDVVAELSEIYKEFERIVKRLANIEIKKAKEENNPEIPTQYEAVQEILGRIHFPNDKTKESVIRDISLISNENSGAEKYSNNFYLNPGSIIQTSLDADEPLSVKIYNYNLNTTPEGYLLSLINSDAHIILSSATAKNKSVLKNFNIDCIRLRNHLYEFTEKAKVLEKEYNHSKEKNKDLINLHIKKTQDYEEDLIKSILSFYDKEQHEYIIENIGQIHSNLRKEYIKDDMAKYYFKEYLKVIEDTLMKIKNKSIANLSLTSFLLNKKEIKFEEIINELLKLYCENVKIFFIRSENMENELKNFQQEIDNGNICFIYTAYETAEKGFNFKIELKQNNIYIENAVSLNTLGDIELKNANQKGIKIDLTGIYLGDITHVYPTMEGIEKDSKIPKTCDILKAIYYANTLYENADITKDELENLMNRILDQCIGNGLFNINRDTPYLAKVLAKIQQAGGRGSRCNIRLKDKYITINSRLIDIFYGFAREDIIDTDSYEKQSFEVRAIIDFIFKNNIETKGKHKERILKESTKIYNKALKDNFHNNKPKKLKELQKNLNRLFYTKEEYLQLPDDVKKLSMEATGDFKYGYSYMKEGTDEWNNDIITRLYRPDSNSITNRRISEALLNLQPEAMKILEKNNIIIRNTGDYIVLPRGYDGLLGNIGEAIATEVFSWFGINLEELPDDIYEEMDLVSVYDDYILAVDAKYYKEKELEYDKEKELQEKYKKKLSKISEHYKKPVIGVEINTRYNKSTEYIMSSKQLDDNIIILVPNIYDENGNIDEDILGRMINKINDCRRF